MRYPVTYGSLPRLNGTIPYGGVERPQPRLGQLWIPEQPGAVVASSLDVDLTTEGGVSLITQGGSDLTMNPNTITPKEATFWS